MKFEHLKAPYSFKEYWSKYPQGYTIYEALLDWVNQVNEMTTVLNLSLSEWEKVKLFVNNELKTYSEDKLIEWLNDGTLDQLIVNAINQFTEEVTLDLNDRGVNLRHLGLKFDGSDETVALQEAINTYRDVIIPPNVTICVSDTIVLDYARSLRGSQGEHYRNVNTSTIKWIGPTNSQKTVIQLGRNSVNSEPTLDATSVVLKNVVIDGDGKAGFGVYSTYLANESQIYKVHVKNTTEHAFYIARSWYTHIEKIMALNNQGNGITLGLPLTYWDGSVVTWTTPNALELNGVVIKDIRAHSNGSRFTDSPGSFNTTSNIRKGYGIAFGQGYGLTINGFTSEANGGVGLYVHNSTENYVRTVVNGYLEDNAKNSGLDPAVDKPEVLLESSNQFSQTLLENIFIGYSSGGIYYYGLSSNISNFNLKNVRYGRFLKSLTGLTSEELNSAVFKQNCGSGLGYYNLSYKDSIPIIQQKVNSRYSFTVEVPTTGLNGYFHVYYKCLTTTPYGGVNIVKPDGTTLTTQSFKTGIQDEWLYLGSYSGTQIEKLTKSGGTGSVDSEVIIGVRFSNPSTS